MAVDSSALENTPDGRTAFLLIPLDEQARRLRLAFFHFNPERLGKIVAALRNYPGFGEALALLPADDIAQRRREVHACRIRDDNWYCEV